MHFLCGWLSKNDGQMWCALPLIFEAHSKPCVFLWVAVHSETCRWECSLNGDASAMHIAMHFWDARQSVHFLCCHAFRNAQMQMQPKLHLESDVCLVGFAMHFLNARQSMRLLHGLRVYGNTQIPKLAIQTQCTFAAWFWNMGCCSDGNVQMWMQINC